MATDARVARELHYHLWRDVFFAQWYGNDALRAWRERGDESGGEVAGGGGIVRGA
ncbi:hypothetical protein HC891_27065, partial [Candidatus Gracilibacteria bacterium]|nr:hypothetical protein [Candidatus Gracilibacteria bacterium]